MAATALIRQTESLESNSFSKTFNALFTNSSLLGSNKQTSPIPFEPGTLFRLGLCYR